MSQFEARRVEALRLLKATGIRPSNYLPRVTQWLWRWGYAVRPPHFVPFGTMWLAGGGCFAVAWGLWMGLIWGWVIPPVVPLHLLGLGVGAVFVGFFVGLFMASYYAYGRRKHALPAWDDLQPAAQPDTLGSS
jgi:hypothetical protein